MPLAHSLDQPPDVEALVLLANNQSKKDYNIKMIAAKCILISEIAEGLRKQVS